MLDCFQNHKNNAVIFSILLKPPLTPSLISTSPSSYSSHSYFALHLIYHSVCTGVLCIFSNSVFSVCFTEMQVKTPMTYGAQTHHLSVPASHDSSKHLTELTTFSFLKHLLCFNLVTPPLFWVSFASLSLTPEFFLDPCQESDLFLKINAYLPLKSDSGISVFTPTPQVISFSPIFSNAIHMFLMQ